MQTNMTVHGVDFTVEFTPDGDTEAIFIGFQDVTEVIRDATKERIYHTVSRNAAEWTAAVSSGNPRQGEKT